MLISHVAIVLFFNAKAKGNLRAQQEEGSALSASPPINTR